MDQLGLFGKKKKSSDFEFSEEQHQRRVCNHLITHYPGVLFIGDIAGVNLNEAQRKRVYSMRSGRGFPDLIILEPNEKYHGLLIEMKKDGFRISNEDGSLIKNSHITEQALVIEKLCNKNYYAAFCIGSDSAIKLIDDYMANKQ